MRRAASRRSLSWLPGGVRPPPVGDARALAVADELAGHPRINRAQHYRRCRGASGGGPGADRPTVPGQGPGADHPRRLPRSQPGGAPGPRLGPGEPGPDQRPGGVGRLSARGAGGIVPTGIRPRLRRPAADVRRAGFAAVLSWRRGEQPQAFRARADASVLQARAQDPERRGVHHQPDRLRCPQAGRTAPLHAAPGTRCSGPRQRGHSQSGRCPALPWRRHPRLRGHR